MFTLKREIETLFLLILAAGIGVFFALSVNKEKTDKLNVNASEGVALEKTASEILPTSTPVVEASTEKQISSDGSRYVVLKKTSGNGGKNIFRLSTTDGSGGDEKVIFNNTLTGDKSVSIPYNSWSPDNKYFFIQENSPEGTSVMVFNNSGEPFADGETFLDLTGIFRDKISEFSFKEATGWASETLIIVNTTRDDGTSGPSYWFEVPSKAVIRLSTLFL